MLARLHVSNLGPIREAVLDDRCPVTLLLGPNESGKSTLLEALHVLYFGSRGGLAVGDNKALTSDGAKGWSIDATVGDDTLSATRSKRPLQEECKRVLGDPRMFRALTYLGSFLEAEPADRKALLADLHATDTGALVAKLEELKAPAPIIDAVRAGKMKRAHTAAVEARRSAGRMLREYKTLAEQEVPDLEVETKQGTLTVSQLPLPTIEGSIQRLRSRRDTIIKGQAAGRQHATVVAAGEKARADLDALEAESSWASGDEHRLAECQREIETWREQAATATGEISAASKADLALKELVKALSPGEVVPCPTCGRPLDEESAKEALTAMHLEASGIINRARKVQESASEATRTLAEERAALAKRKAAADAHRVYRRKLEELVQAGEDAAPPEETGETSADLDGEISRVGKMRDMRRDYEQAIRAKDGAADRIAETQAKVDGFAQIEHLCDPSAMANEADVLEQLNGLLERTTGKLGAPVVVSPGYEVTVQGRHVALAADSVKIRAGFGVACALSVISGVGLALLDRFESLDDDNRKRALGMVKGLVDDGLLSTVLIGAVKVNPTRGADVPWLAWVKVEDGTAIYL